MKGFDRYTPNSEMALFYLHLTTRMIRVIRRVCWGKRIISFTTRDFPLKIKHFQTKKLHGGREQIYTSSATVTLDLNKTWRE